MSIQGSLGDAGASSTANDISDTLMGAQPSNSEEEVQQQNQSKRLDRLVEARARHNDNLERQLTPEQRNTLSQLPPHERRIAMQFMNQGQGPNMPQGGPAGKPPHSCSDPAAGKPILEPMAKTSPEPTAQLGKTEYTPPSPTSGTPITPSGPSAPEAIAPTTPTTPGVTQGTATPGGQLGSIDGPAIPTQVDNPNSSQATPTGSSVEASATTQSGQATSGPNTLQANQTAPSPTTPGTTQGTASEGGQLGSIDGPAIPNQADNPANTPSSSQATPSSSSVEASATTQSEQAASGPTNPQASQTVPGTTTPSTPEITQGAASQGRQLGSIDGPAIPNQVDNPANTPSSSQTTPTSSSVEASATIQSGQATSGPTNPQASQTVPGTTTPSTPGTTQGAATPGEQLGSIDGPAIPNQIDNPNAPQVAPGAPAAQSSTTTPSSNDTDNVAAVSEQAGATAAQNAANTTTTTGTQNVQQANNTNAAQTIAEIANKIVDSIRVMDARPMGGTQEVVIKLGADVLPGTEVNIKMQGDKLSVTFSSTNAQSSSFLTETTLSQLTSNLQGSLNSQDASNNKQIQVSVANPNSGAVTEDGITRREEGSSGGDGGNSDNQGDQPQE